MRSSKHLRSLAATLILLAALGPVSPLMAQQPPAAPGNRLVIVLDAAHGGSDSGAEISPALEEKTVTLEMATHLRTLLQSRGFHVVMTRTGDTDPDLTTRAGMANHAQAAACLILHATASGAGVHLFTSSLAPAPRTAVPAWATAQASYVNASIRLSSDMDAALTPTGIPVVVGRTFLQPLDNLTCPAVAVELAPMQSGSITRGETLDDPHYQTQVLTAIAAALVQWRQDWSGQP
jgi:N-acetylmuramoyl-L-alanine amidase